MPRIALILLALALLLGGCVQEKEEVEGWGLPVESEYEFIDPEDEPGDYLYHHDPCPPCPDVDSLSESALRLWREMRMWDSLFAVPDTVRVMPDTFSWYHDGYLLGEGRGDSALLPVVVDVFVLSRPCTVSQAMFVNGRNPSEMARVLNDMGCLKSVVRSLQGVDSKPVYQMPPGRWVYSQKTSLTNSGWSLFEFWWPDSLQAPDSAFIPEEVPHDQ